jgi:hypothetical protein
MRRRDIPFIQRNWSGGTRGCNPVARLATILLLAGCATGTKTTTAQPEAAPSHVYPLPLDSVLAQAASLLVQKGWQVQRSGDVLVTNWVDSETRSSPQQYQAEGASVAGSLVGYRVFGERIDTGYCTIRVERLVATPSTLDFGQKKGGHQVEQTTTSGARDPTAVHNVNRTLMSPFEFEEDLPNESPTTGVPSGMVVSQQGHDKTLELALQEQIDPLVAAPKQADALALAATADAPADARVSVVPEQTTTPVQRLDREPRVGVGAPLVGERRPSTLAGIWDGTFTFRGKVTGSFSGEVTVAVDGDSVEIDDFCPESGGTLSALGSGDSAGWRGKLACPAIRLRACPSATFVYESLNATLNDGTLTLVASGNVGTGGRCIDSGGELGVGGELSVTFIARKADYVHIAVTRAKRATECVWPRDWEDFASSGSMAMPDAPLEDAAYLGIIRAKGSRLTEIQRLLRHCRQVVLLHGQPVLMKLAATRSHQ